MQLLIDFSILEGLVDFESDHSSPHWYTYPQADNLSSTTKHYVPSGKGPDKEMIKLSK